jgi:hypothetical protein
VSGAGEAVVLAQRGPRGQAAPLGVPGPGAPEGAG